MATYVGLAKFGVNVSTQIVMILLLAEFLFKSVIDVAIFSLTTLGLNKLVITTDSKLKPIFKSMIA